MTQQLSTEARELALNGALLAVYASARAAAIALAVAQRLID
jgi:hypothetical protein